jgi:hypothetical protein
MPSSGYHSAIGRSGGLATGEVGPIFEYSLLSGNGRSESRRPTGQKRRNQGIAPYALRPAQSAFLAFANPASLQKKTPLEGLDWTQMGV